MKKFLVISITAAGMLYCGSLRAEDGEAKDKPAQAASQGGKNFIIQTGIGYRLFSAKGSAVVPTLNLSGEYRFNASPKVPVSVGGAFGYARTEFGKSWMKAYYNYYAFGLKSAFYFNGLLDLKNVDLYAGVLLGGVAVGGSGRWLGVKISGRNVFIAGAPDDDGYFLIGLNGGVRYYVTEKVGIFLEMGFGLGYLNAGVAFKF
ncbi:MAG: hypothetical protein MUD12_15805 [Spirochaetes bacterium]|jgi:hypothetical protein|nr:hypothetical protein [Spirochaetota bacterium]